MANDRRQPLLVTVPAVAMVLSALLRSGNVGAQQ